MSVKPITTTLALLHGGVFIDTASDKLAELVKMVDETGKAGTLTISLALKKVRRRAPDRSRQEGPAVWCNFDPQSASLSFAAVLDEHSPEHAGWRGHQAVYTPRMSIEWMNWKGSNGSQKTMGQVDFAEFIEKNGVGSLKLRVFIQTLGTGVGVGLFYAAAQFAHKVWGIPLPGGS